MSKILYTHFDLMQNAVDIVLRSEHPTSKVAATLFIQDQNCIISDINHWPATISAVFKNDERIGNTSGTIHAETACLFQAPLSTHNSAMYITDPPCPNCVKNMTLAGIKHIYIDHKGFDKEFAKKRASVFENMSLEICKKGGIDVFKIYRKEQKIVPLLSHSQSSHTDNQRLFFQKETSHCDDNVFLNFIHERKENYGHMPFATALMVDQKDPDLRFWVSTKQSWPPGFNVSDNHDEPIIMPDNKYSFHCEPLNALMMLSIRLGKKLDNTYIYSSRIPTSRELVNFIGAGYNKIKIGNIETARDIHAPQALKKLLDANVISLT